jgi:hypothetical protein
MQGTRWRCWLRHCATKWKVAGSIRDGIIDSLNLSGRTVDLGSIQPVTEMTTRDITWRLRRSVPNSCTDCLENPEGSTYTIRTGVSKPVQVLFYLAIHSIILVSDIVIT